MVTYNFTGTQSLMNRFVRKIGFIGLLLLSQCQTLPAYSQSSDLEKIRTSSFEGGVNSKDFFDTLKPTESAHLENLEISNKGQAITRKGQSLFLTDVGSTAFLGLNAYYLDATTSYLVAASGTAVVRSNTTDWTQISTASMGAGHDTGFIQANKLFFVYNGSAHTSWWDGTTWTTGGTWPGSVSPPTATTSAWLANYLFLAGDPAQPDWVYVSNNLNPRAFDALDILPINTGDGQKVQRLEPYRTGDIIIYKDRSIYDLNIASIDSTCSPQPTCQWSIKPLSKDLGTPAPRSVVSLGNDQWFLSSPPYAIRSLSSSQFDKVFVNINSLPIQDVFNGNGERIINTTQISKAAGVIYDNKYFLAIPTGSSTVNDFVVVYDFLTQGWTTITGWYPKDWIVYQNNLYYSDANDGRVVQCLTGVVGDFGTNHSSASGPTVAINNDIQTRGIDFGNPENFKALDALSLEFYPTGDYNAMVSINIDNSGWQNVGTVNLSGNALTLPFTLPATLNGDGFAIRTLQLQKYGEFKRIQARVELDETSETLKLQAIDFYSRIKPWRREQ